MATKKTKKELNVPVIPEETIEALRSKDAEIRANALTDVLGRTLPVIPKSFQYRLDDQDNVKNAFHHTFICLGGVGGMVDWASQNPNEFYKLYTKLLPAPQNVLATTGNIIINSNVPQSPLNNAAPIQSIDAIDPDLPADFD